MRSQRVNLFNIQALSFYQDRYTTARRVDALPQQICEGSLCSEHAPEVIQCINMGGEGSDIDWKCEASLPVEVRLGRCDVSCEGWTGPSDPWVLKGSCSLNYRLMPSSMYASKPAKIPSESSESEGSLGDTLFYIAFWAVFLIIVFSFLRSVFFPPDQAQAGGHDDGDDQPPGGPQPFFNDGYDGPDDGYDPRPGFRGGGGGPQDPPPPYTPRSKPTHQPGQAANTGGAGFWTGLLAGGLGTQALNGTGQPRQQPRARRGRRFDEDTFGYVDRGEGSSTGVTRTSTGFGGTANR